MSKRDFTGAIVTQSQTQSQNDFRNMPSVRGAYIPKKRFSRKSRRAKTTNVRRTWPLATRGNGMLFDPFPAKITAILRYSTSISLDPSLGTPGPYLFRANSIHDPDFTGIGHQPYGHDTYASIYNHYNVRSAIITMTPSLSRNGVMGISLTDDSTVQSDYDTIRETKGTRFATITADGGLNPSVKNYYNVNQNFDIPFQKATSASFGASPSEGMYFHCWFEAADSTSDQSAASFIITISYVVDMWELRDLGQS